MKRSEMLELMAEGILQTHLFGGSPEEREEVRKDTYMRRVIMANAALVVAENEGMMPPAIPYDTWYVNQWDEENGQ